MPVGDCSDCFFQAIVLCKFIASAPAVETDAPETAAFEIGLWFTPAELSDWTPADQVWRVEG